MKAIQIRDTANMLAACAAIAIMPLCLWLCRPRPLSGETSAEIAALAREFRQEQILEQMHKRYESVNLSFEGPDLTYDASLRWQQVQESMQSSGARPDEANQIAQEAQKRLGEAWPCLVERGLWRGQEAWIFVASTPCANGIVAWICPPSSAEVRREQVKRYCTDVRACAVSVRPPYRVLD